MNQRRSNRLWQGLLALPISAILGAGVLLLRGPLSFPLTDDSGWIEIVTSSNFLILQDLLTAAYVLAFVGFLALYEVLREDVRTKRLALVGFILTLWGTALAMPSLGIVSFVAPIAGQSGVSDQVTIGRIVTEAVTGPGLLVGIVAGVFYTAGPLLFGIAIWRDAGLSKVAAVLFVIHGVLLSFGFSIFPAVILGWVLLAISGILISLGVRRQNHA